MTQTPETREPPPAQNLAQYLQTDETDYVRRCEIEAIHLVTRHIGSKSSEVPDSIIQKAILEVGSEIYHRQSTRDGVESFGGLDFNPKRISRDPLRAAYDLLNPYLGPGIA